MFFVHPRLKGELYIAGEHGIRQTEGILFWLEHAAGFAHIDRRGASTPGRGERKTIGVTGNDHSGLAPKGDLVGAIERTAKPQTLMGIEGRDGPAGEIGGLTIVLDTCALFKDGRRRGCQVAQLGFEHKVTSTCVLACISKQAIIQIGDAIQSTKLELRGMRTVIPQTSSKPPLSIARNKERSKQRTSSTLRGDKGFGRQRHIKRKGTLVKVTGGNLDRLINNVFAHGHP